MEVRFNEDQIEHVLNDEEIVYIKSYNKSFFTKGELEKNCGKNNFTKVRHMPNSSKYEKPKGNYDGWLNFWEKHFKSINPFLETDALFFCPCCRKSKKLEEFVGAHVMDIDDVTYIYPLCKSCNDKAKGDNEFSQKYFTVLKQWLVPFSPQGAVSSDGSQKG